MNQDEIESLASEYVLGTLDSEARSLFRDRLATDLRLHEAVRDWEERLSELSSGETPLAPTAGLWDKIAAALDEEPGDGRDSAAEGFAITVRSDEGQWDEICPGVRRKHLFIDRKAGYRSSLLKFEPGGRLPSHSHSATEECIMLEGEASVGDLHLSAGDYHVISGGVAHPEITSESGALIYVRGEIRAAA